MILWTIPIIGLALIIWGILTWGKDYSDKAATLLVAGTFLTVIPFLILIIIITVNFSDTAQWKAFYNFNAQNYEITSNTTATYLSDEKITAALVNGSLEKMQLANTVSERLKESRDAFNQYNLSVATLKAYKHNFWTSSLVPDEVDNLKFLVLK